MHANSPLSDRKSQACATGIARSRLVDAIKTIKDSFGVFRRDSWTKRSACRKAGARPPARRMLAINAVLHEAIGLRPPRGRPFRDTDTVAHALLLITSPRLERN
jgi:hypothetical protein